MTTCPNVPGGKACQCQPQDGVFCPDGEQPPWRPYAEQSDLAVCPSCKLRSTAWSDDDLLRGWRMLDAPTGMTKEYHCMRAFYELQ